MTATPCYIESSAEPKITFVRLPQAIDVTNDSVVLESLAAALAGRSSIVVADGGGTAFCDCAGISALICAHRQAIAAGAQLRVVTASVQVRRLIKLTAACDVLDVYRTVDDALADITGPPPTDLAPAVPVLTGETE
jgi:anti-sigma B factor antagonist